MLQQLLQNDQIQLDGNGLAHQFGVTLINGRNEFRTPIGRGAKG